MHVRNGTEWQMCPVANQLINYSNSMHYENVQADGSPAMQDDVRARTEPGSNDLESVRQHMFPIR